MHYGRDYSEREFTDQEFKRYMRENPQERPVDFLGRYIGYPTNKKCISYYPGMYRHHLEAGRPAFLFHQIGYGDLEGGFDAGRQHATVAFTDATSSRVGWSGESHIVACMDRFYAKQGYRTLSARDLREYMRGFRSVLGDRAGFYGFYDSMRDALSEGWASFYVQCGARSAQVPGIHAWQENNYQPRIFGTSTDILELYSSWEYAFGGDDMPSAREVADTLLNTAMDTVQEVLPDGKEVTHPSNVREVLRWSDFRERITRDQLATLTAKVDALTGALTDDEAKVVAAIREQKTSIIMTDAQVQALLNGLSAQTKAALKAALREGTGE